jgi:hypothetical protein
MPTRTAAEIVSQIDGARERLLDFEIGLRVGSRVLDEFEEMRATCDRALRLAALGVAELDGRAA